MKEKELTPKQKRQLEQIGEVASKGNVAIVRMIFELQNRLDEELPAITTLLGHVKGPKGDKGDKGDKLELTRADKKEISALAAELVSIPVGKIAELAAEMVPKPKDGKTPSKTELLELVKPLIEKIEPRQGKPGKDADEKAILAELVSKLPALGEAIRDALELLQGDERLDKSAIKGLEEALEKMSKRIEQGVGGRSGNGGGPRLVQYFDISPQCNGVRKTYQVPTFSRLVGLRGTQFPIIYRPGTDFTLGKNSLTLTAEVSAVEAGQTLLLEYIK